MNWWFSYYYLNSPILKYKSMRCNRYTSIARSSQFSSSFQVNIFIAKLNGESTLYRVYIHILSNAMYRVQIYDCYLNKTSCVKYWLCNEGDECCQETALIDIRHEFGLFLSTISQWNQI